MRIEQHYTNCLAQGAYYIESEGEVAIIDPIREVDQYIKLAKERNASIKYVFETHFHADFVSGHVDLAKRTGATIVYGPTSLKPGFECLIGTDNQLFKLGNISIKLIHTPGHTMESACFLLYDEDGNPHSLFSGDTLFIGDVGRPDLAQHVIADLTEEKLAGHLFESLRNKIMPLPDDLIVYPGHGAGSACGKNLSKETTDTLGNQKRTNYALNPSLSKNEFIKEVLTGLMPPPAYFPKNVLMNIQGYESIDSIIERGMHPIEVYKFKQLSEKSEFLVIDTRIPKEFICGFIPNSVNIGIDGTFAVWVGTLVKDINQKIILVVESGREEEVVTRLARVGYDYCLGYLEGGFEAWEKAGLPIDTIETITSEKLYEASLLHPDYPVFDVRKRSEYNSEHLLNTTNAPLDYFEESIKKINPDVPSFVHCQSGYRSSTFISFAKKKGFSKLINVGDGFVGIKNLKKFKLSEYTCPNTML